jgi:hypothetical protein
MMAVIEAALAVIGLVLLILVAWLALTDPPEPPKSYVIEVNAPSWEGLLAAVRLQQTAQELERQIYAEAARYVATGLLPPPASRDL